jgi:ribosomal protein S18 acetylase RimI-like enzyme
MKTFTIRTATAADEQPVIDAITLAFCGDPAARWVYPDSHQYVRCFPEFVRAFAGRAFEHGTAHLLEGRLGAALWLPPGVQPDESALVALLQRTVSAADQASVFSVLEQMGGFHPEEPHWYLPLIGVDPVWQGQGCGSALMKHALAVCDRERRLAYLESTNPKNILLYERHGFEVLGKIQMGSSPPIVPMLRKPGSP